MFPYLLRDMKIDYSNQVWATDITYIRMHQGWLYLVAIMDWYSRYVVGWEISNTLDVYFCLEVLERPGARISMDGRGRIYDNIFIERLWRTVKYEEVYLYDECLSDRQKRWFNITAGSKNGWRL